MDRMDNAGDAILRAVSLGKLSPSEGVALANILKEHRLALEATDFDQRLSAL